MICINYGPVAPGGQQTKAVNATKSVWLLKASKTFVVNDPGPVAPKLGPVAALGTTIELLSYLR